MCCRRLLTDERKASLRWLRKEVWVLLLRKFQSEYHARRWVDYENVLIVRTMMYMASRIVLATIFALIGSE